MRRPLFLVCLCLVLAAWVFHGKSRGGTEEALLEPRTSEGAAGEGLSLDGSVITATGRVCQKDSEYFYLDSILICTILEQDAAFLQQTISLTEKLMCEYPEDADDTKVLLGSTVAVRGTVYAFSCATNPGEFDMASYYHSLEIGGKLRRVSLLEHSVGYSRWQEGLYGLKGYFHRRLNAVFPEKEASVMCTMLLGEKKGLDSEVKGLYQRNGIAHILSISGLHITIIGVSIFSMLRRAGAPVWLAAVLGGGVLILYGVMTGMSVSAVRAIGMYLLRLLGEAVGRTYDMLTALGVMAAILVWSNQGNFDNAGFYLSFGAVLGIGTVYPALLPERTREPVKRKKAARLWEKLRQSMLSGLAVTITTLPIQLWYYYEIPVYSVFLNLLVIPLMSTVMLTGLIAMLVPGLGILGTIDCLILESYEKLCLLSQSLPFHTWNPGRPEAWQVAAYYVLLLGMVLVKQGVRRKNMREKGQRRSERGCRRRGQAVRFLPGIQIWRERLFKLRGKGLCRIAKLCQRLALPLVLTAAVTVLTLRFPHETSVTFLDVGQGDCICVQTASGEVYLFDCGSSSRSQVGQYVLKPYLKYCGISHIDGVFVSHRDSDHCNGVEELLAHGEEWGITVGRVFWQEEVWTGQNWVSGGTSGDGSARSGGNAGNAPALSGGVRFTCLHPDPGETPEETNAVSQCFYIQLENGVTILLTGDVEGEGEERLLTQLRKRQIDKVTVLKVAHHGSKNSTHEELLEQIQPQAAVISCGENNAYGHPHEELLQRLEACGAIPLITYETGAVTLRENGEYVSVETYLAE